MSDPRNSLSVVGDTETPLPCSTTVCKDLYYDECGTHIPVVPVPEIGLLGSITVFFLAFYSSSCYSRFQQQYNSLKHIEGQMRAICVIMRFKFHAPNANTLNGGDGDGLARFKMMELVRYLGASYYLLFALLMHGEELSLDLAYEEMGIITADELRILKKLPASMVWFRCTCWAFHVVQEAVEEGLCSADTATRLENEILEVRGRMHYISAEQQLMVPLAYFHLINGLTIATVLVFSYAFAQSATDWKLYLIIWAIVSVGILGMREVAVQLAEPFGEDDTDLPVAHYVTSTLRFLTYFLKNASARPRKNQHFNQQGFWCRDLHLGTKRQVDAYVRAVSAQADRDNNDKRLNKKSLGKMVDSIIDSAEFDDDMS